MSDPIEDVKTEPNGDQGCADIWREVLEILRKQAQELEEIRKELEKVKGDLDVIRVETVSHGVRLAASDERCSDRCSTLRKLMSDRDTDQESD